MYLIQQQQSPLLPLDQIHDLSTISTALASVGDHVEGGDTDAGLLEVGLVAGGKLLVVLGASNKPVMQTGKSNIPGG